MNSNTKLLLGVLAGAAAGYIVATLLAPAKGSDLRNSIRESVNDLTQRVNDFINEKEERVASVVQNLKESTDEIAADMQTTVIHGKQIVS